MGIVRAGKAPTQEYTVIWRNLRTGEVATETRTEKLNTLRGYIFNVGMNYNFTGTGQVLGAEIWRTYKTHSKRIYTY
ncbi:hypothetical protein AB0L74_10160 [Streptomyces sp. NPDC052020]|uniref:hypothetical protein n=1 Tax=Streptomyces sp. NPDC052020 TaxID=3155677 RepID=UPI00341AB08D